ncbi:3-oxoacyl-[acyl-carrier-protein] synthase III C-terminal domain-containing protein [Saccharothrix sp. ST-888]|uniref:3-oxoacyl-[acyl-carrier-protein] synthase III C-terminal domain-containing protein n=1 Tax=Saccharothrix sp. ST-888 TaxID=1427391 RepID=UPI0005EC4891|nr:3-oxoacyl-[acyl-carrier-protein] synthase III C-terminal domain-containing protein [Saccharothrix sp. ST-888]KJK55117.1 3-oxoacyl-ACP synthase [Saccharothrix sp. ST-888]
MLWNDIYIDAAATRLGRLEDVRQAAAEGRYDPAECEADDLVSVSVVDDASQADMAVEAAGLAVSRSRAAHEDYTLVAHVSSGTFHGLDHWAPASYIQARTVGGKASAIQLQQASNGGLGALDLVAAHLAARPAPAAALITTSDKYQLPMFDRYRSDKGAPRGDGATAVVLRRGEGIVRLVSTVVISDTAFEGMYRGTAQWEEVAGEQGWPINMRKRLKEFLIAGDVQVADIAQALAGGQQASMLAAMGEAGVDIKDVARFIYPHSGATQVDWETVKAVAGVDVGQTNWELGRRLGHLGAGDQFAALADMLENKLVGPGDLVVMSALGHGFNFGAAVLEIVAEPQWS